MKSWRKRWKERRTECIKGGRGRYPGGGGTFSEELGVSSWPPPGSLPNRPC